MRYPLMPSPTMLPFSQTIFMLLLNRLQTKPSPQFSQSFVYFITFLSAVDNVGADAVIKIIEGIQPGLFGNLMTGVVLPNTQKAPVRSRRVIEVGLTNLLTKSDATLTGPIAQIWPPTFLALVDLFNLPQDLTYTSGTAEDLTALDPEEGGFQSSFSKLGASEAQVHDPVRSIPDTKKYASNQLALRSKERPGVLPPLLQQAQVAESQEAQADAGAQAKALSADEFVKYMTSNGDSIV